MKGLLRLLAAPREHGILLNLLSLTGSPLADVFFVGSYEKIHAIVPKEGRWIGVGVENRGQPDTGC